MQILRMGTDSFTKTYTNTRKDNKSRTDTETVVGDYIYTRKTTFLF